MTTITAAELGYKQLPNYSTHAGEFMTKTAKQLSAELGISTDLEEFFAQYLSEAIVFLLPDNGYLFEDHDFKPSMYDLQRLPYPMCALEFTATDELFNPTSGLAQSKKRIALCFDPHQLPDNQKARLTRLRGREFLATLPPRCMCVMSLFELEDLWSGSVGIVLVNLDGDTPMKLSDSPNDLRELTRRVEDKFAGEKTEHGLPVDFLAFPERARLVGQSPEQAMEAIYIDTLDEIRTTYEFLAAINCSNVGTVEIPAPKMLNLKRAKKNKPLFRPYKVLDLGVVSVAAGDSGGTHASPRAHLRRGHIRRLGARSNNRTIWVNATRVNTSRGDPISKIYRVKS